MPALQHFFDAERRRRGWSMRDLAEKAQISPSKAYAIANGDDNVEFETFENIATAFNMSPAELATVIGKGPASADPFEIETLAILRQTEPEVRPTIQQMIRGLVEPTLGPTNRRIQDTTKRAEGERRKLANRRQPPARDDHEGPLTRRYRRVGDLVSILRPAFVAT